MARNKERIMVPMETRCKNNTSNDIDCTCPECGANFSIPNPLHDTSRNLMQECKRCGFQWKSRTEKPLKCPKCGSYSWDKSAKTYQCTMCNHEWVSRTDEEPMRCPKCKSVKWNRNVQSTKAVMEHPSEDEQDIQEKWIWKKYSEGKGCFQIAIETGLPFFQGMDVLRERTGYSFVKP